MYKLTPKQSIFYYGLDNETKATIRQLLMDSGMSRRVVFRTLAGSRAMKQYEYEFVQSVLQPFGMYFNTPGKLTKEANARHRERMEKLNEYRKQNKKALQDYQNRK